MRFFDNSGAFLGTAPARPITGKDLGEFGSSGRTGAGYAPGGTTQYMPSDATLGNYWARASGVIFPSTPGDYVAINQYGVSYGARLSVNGNIAAAGYLFSDTVFITKDGSDNMVFTDVIAGSKTLSQLIATGGGDVMVSGTPINLQLAQWINTNTIQGLDISALTLTQSQITGLVAALANKASKVHNLVDTTNHPAAGLTPGNVLMALTPTSYGFAAPAAATSLWKQVGLTLSPLDASIDIIQLNAASYILGQTPLMYFGSGTSGEIRGHDVTDAVGSNLIIRGGDANGGTRSGGNLYLSGGNPSGASSAGIVYLGHPTYPSNSVNLYVTGTLSDIALNIMPKGNGTLTIMALSTLSLVGINYIYLQSPSVYLTGGFDTVMEKVYHSEATGWNLSIKAGKATSAIAGNHNGGDLHLMGGEPCGTGVAGDVYIGTGTVGTNPLPEAGVSDTYMLTYNPSTGKISCMLI